MSITTLEFIHFLQALLQAFGMLFDNGNGGGGTGTLGS